MKTALLGILLGAVGFGATITHTSVGGMTISSGEPSTQSVDILFTDSRLITGGLQVTINSFTHSWVGDLSLTLTHVDTGTNVSLMQRPGRLITATSGAGHSADFGGTYTFADTGATTVAAWTAANNGVVPSGTYRASEDQGSSDDVAILIASAFNGQAAGGTWRLTVADAAEGDGGGFTNWTVQMNVADEVSGIPEPGTWTLLSGGLALVAVLRRRG